MCRVSGYQMCSVRPSEGPLQACSNKVQQSTALPTLDPIVFNTTPHNGDNVCQYRPLIMTELYFWHRNIVVTLLNQPAILLVCKIKWTASVWGQLQWLDVTLLHNRLLSEPDYSGLRWALAHVLKKLHFSRQILQLRWSDYVMTTMWLMLRWLCESHKLMVSTVPN